MATAAALTRTPATVPEPPPVPVRRFTVAEFHKLLNAGILGPEERIELFEGWLVEKERMNPPHASTVYRLQTRLMRLLSDDWICRVQLPVTLPTSEPQPDFAVVRGPDTRYDHAHPKPKDVALLIEVAESTLEFDRKGKLEVYARNRIPVYWIVNLIDGRVEVFTQPRGGKAPTFQRHEHFNRGASVPVVLDGVEIGRIAVNDFIPSGA
jgi:Uma2 family endonuclease